MDWHKIVFIVSLVAITVTAAAMAVFAETVK